jgi:hypothetical protein
MDDREILIIDDIEPALRQQSALGQSVVGPIARAFREAVLLCAAARGWEVVHHSAFRAWACCSRPTSKTWLVLDPLIPPHEVGPTAYTVRLTRALGPKGWALDATELANSPVVLRGGEFAILDDVAATGTTLSVLDSVISEGGGRVTEFVLCASSKAAKDGVTARLPSAQWSAFRTGDWKTVHLRDGCPGLAFAGRRIEGLSPVVTERGLIPVRVPPLNGGPWEHLRRNRSIAHAIGTARRSLWESFSNSLGRPATVSDVPLLGDNVAIPLFSTLPPTAESLLQSVLVG